MADDGWDIGDNVLTITTRNILTGHWHHCVLFGSYIAPNETR